MNLKEIEERKASILIDMDKPDADIDALTVEARSLNEEAVKINEVQEKRSALLAAAAAGKGVVVEQQKEERTMVENIGLDSKEYRSAYFKNLAGETLNEVEQRAFIATTANFGGALPITTLNEIWSNIAENHPILGDIKLYRTGTVLEVSVHTAIAAGDAAVTAQGVAATDEENTFVKVTLSGKDFAKNVEVSYALGTMSAPALEDYLKTEISDRLGAALAADVVAQIIADMTAGNKLTSAAVKVTTYAELNKVFALVKGGRPTMYVNSACFYNYLTSIVDTTGRPVFQPNAQADIQGSFLGAQVKIEDAVTANLFLLGVTQKVAGNMVQDIMIESDKDIKRHVNIHAGYARFECKLTYADAFASLAIKQA